MTDPLEQLRGFDAPSSSPDVGAIRARSRRIQRRRQMALGGGAVAVALFAVVGVLIQADPVERPTTLAQRAVDAPSAQIESVPDGATAGAEGSGSTKSSAGGATSAGSAGAAPAETPTKAEPGRSSDAAALTASEGSKGQGLDATLEVKDRTVGRGAVFTLKACNPSTNETSRTFRSGQRYDFEVTRGEEVIWRWSDGMVFTQAVVEEHWKAKECKSWTEEWDGVSTSGTPASPGTYDASGILKSQPEQGAETKSFCLDVC